VGVLGLAVDDLIGTAWELLAGDIRAAGQGVFVGPALWIATAFLALMFAGVFSRKR
jgi:hypothetical protein